MHLLVDNKGSDRQRRPLLKREDVTTGTVTSPQSTVVAMCEGLRETPCDGLPKPDQGARIGPNLILARKKDKFFVHC